MSRDEIVPHCILFDAMPNSTAKRNLSDTQTCFNCQAEVDPNAWLAFNIPSSINDFEQPFCDPGCFLNAIREYRDEGRFFFAQQFIANMLAWYEPMDLSSESQDASYTNAKRHKIQ